MGEMLAQLVEGWQYLIDFISSGIYEFVIETTAYMIKASVIFAVQIQIWFVQFSWDVAKEIIANLSITDEVITRYDGLNVDVKNTLGALMLPDAFNMIINAGVTKFVMRSIGVA